MVSEFFVVFPKFPGLQLAGCHWFHPPKGEVFAGLLMDWKRFSLLQSPHVGL